MRKKCAAYLRSNVRFPQDFHRISTGFPQAQISPRRIVISYLHILFHRLKIISPLKTSHLARKASLSSIQIPIKKISTDFSTGCKSRNLNRINAFCEFSTFPHSFIIILYFLLIFLSSVVVLFPLIELSSIGGKRGAWVPLYEN